MNIYTVYCELVWRYEDKHSYNRGFEIFICKRYEVQQTKGSKDKKSNNKEKKETKNKRIKTIKKKMTKKSPNRENSSE